MRKHNDINNDNKTKVTNSKSDRSKLLDLNDEVRIKAGQSKCNGAVQEENETRNKRINNTKVNLEM